MNQYTYTLTSPTGQHDEARCTAPNELVARWHIANTYSGHEVSKDPKHITEPHRFAGEIDASENGHADIVSDYYRRAARAMRSGGHFAESIGTAYLVADSHNGPRLIAAFPELFARFAD
jgi:hypothetical protein